MNDFLPATTASDLARFAGEVTRVATCVLLLSVSFAYGSPVDSAEALPLVRSGQPLARIVLSENPTKLESFAAVELRAYIRKATGAELAIVADTAVSDDETIICIGRNRFSAKLAAAVTTAPTDAIRLKRDGNRLLLIGRDSPDLDPQRTGSRTLGSQRGTIPSTAIRRGSARTIPNGSRCRPVAIA